TGRPSALVRSPPRPRDRDGRCPSATRTWCRPGTGRSAQAGTARAPARPVRQRGLRALPCRPSSPAALTFLKWPGQVLELSLREADGLGHNYIGTEHLLLGLIREGSGVAARVLVKLGAD